MGFKRMILEQSDDNYHDEYVPERGEAFFQGFSGGLVSVGKFVLFLAIVILIYLIAC
jgi:hypothetical protein